MLIYCNYNYLVFYKMRKEKKYVLKYKMKDNKKYIK